MPKMPYGDPRAAQAFGGNRSKITKLEKKDEFSTFKLIDPEPEMIGVHWVNKKPYTCPRVNQDSQIPCARCQEGFEILKERNQLMDKGNSKEDDTVKALKEKANAKLPQVKFYYKAIFLDGAGKGTVGFFEAGKTVYDELGRYVEQGLDLLSAKWRVQRTEQNPYYSLQNLGPAPELTEKQESDALKLLPASAEVQMNLKPLPEDYRSSVLHEDEQSVVAEDHTPEVSAEELESAIPDVSFDKLGEENPKRQLRRKASK